MHKEKLMTTKNNTLMSEMISAAGRLKSKKHIWMDKLPRLGEAEASQLATTFDFSGGEIDNIVRKALMEEVISGKTPDMERMTTLCREEKMAGRDKGKGVGFK